ncbi:hypothetical protein [Actinokineospora sp. UTMC 2448]|uniref:hypothetical protein n=1 Tax=Actinokineospora sp. UTMC 2448 TaxID=2268449 RepID=UPI0021FEFE7D|nr:hypothetical protein Actkin_02393 [Actinokineospora sp. UTMC 2448]
MADDHARSPRRHGPARIGARHPRLGPQRPAATTPFEAYREWASGHAPATLRRTLSFSTRLHGVVSLDLAGHFAGLLISEELHGRPMTRAAQAW